jgi:hypothetical protein
VRSAATGTDPGGSPDAGGSWGTGDCQGATGGCQAVTNSGGSARPDASIIAPLKTAPATDNATLTSSNNDENTTARPPTSTSAVITALRRTRKATLARNARAGERASGAKQQDNSRRADRANTSAAPPGKARPKTAPHGVQPGSGHLLASDDTVQVPAVQFDQPRLPVELGSDRRGTDEPARPGDPVTVRETHVGLNYLLGCERSITHHRCGRAKVDR